MFYNNDEEKRLYQKYKKLDEKWEKAAEEAKTMQEYDATKPLDEEALKAFKNWWNYRFNNRKPRS